MARRVLLRGPARCADAGVAIHNSAVDAVRTRARVGSAFSVFRVLRRRQVPLGMLAIAVFFMGQFALFTFLRPFLETVTRVNVSTLSVMLLILGGAGLLGTYLIGFLLRTRLYSLLIAMPVAMAAIAVAFRSRPIDGRRCRASRRLGD